MVTLNDALPAARGILEGDTHAWWRGGSNPPDPDPDPGQSLSITAPATVTFEQDGNLDISVQTSHTAQCRWDYADGNDYPFVVLYQDMSSTDGVNHYPDRICCNRSCALYRMSGFR